MAEISLLNRQRARTIDLQPLSRFAQRALEKVEAVKRTALPAEIVAVLVSDRRISALHLQFMQIAGPTDVITFQHGEIIISVETAHRQATQLGKKLLPELCLYLLHGLLHLAGYDDTTDSGFREMQRLQRRLMREIGFDFPQKIAKADLNRSSRRSQRRWRAYKSEFFL
jgi:probable rRNA maturation factor